MVVITVIIPHFIIVEIEAQKGYVTHPRSCRQEWVDPVTSASVDGASFLERQPVVEGHRPRFDLPK